MIYNLLESFKKAYEIKGDDLIIENHNLKEGLYIRINKSLDFEPLIIKKDSTKDRLFEWFRKADFYSSVINTNKAVADKKIHSSNYLSLFMKKKTIIGDEKETLPKDVILEKITKYFDVLIGEKYNSKKISEDLGLEIDSEKYEFCRDALTNGYDKIYSVIEGMKGEFDNYVKIFFDFEDWEIYRLESNRYLYQKVFNSDKYNVFINDELFGLSNVNMGLNAKKPFLEHKTLKCKVPFMINVGDALLLYKYSLWLKNNKLGPNFKSFDYDYKVPLKDSNVSESTSDSLYLYFSNKNGEIEFSDFDIIPAFLQKVDFVIRNYIKASYYDNEVKSVVAPDYSQFNGRTRNDFLASLDDKLYINKLKNSFKAELKDIKPPRWGGKEFCNILILTKQQVFNFVNKNDLAGIKASIEKYYRFLVLENLKLSKKRGIDACNTYIALKIFFDLGGEKKVQKIGEIRRSMTDYINNEAVHDLEDIYQYSFLAGQIAYYLISKSKASNKNHDVVERVINYTTVEAVNGELKYWFKRYGHAINLNHRMFNKAFSMVLAYNKESRIDEDIFLAGYLGDNIFYKGKGE